MRSVYPETLPKTLLAAAYTSALFEWIEDDARLHPTNLATSLDQWLVILAGYASAVQARPIEMPFDPPDDLLPDLVALPSPWVVRIIGATEPWSPALLAVAWILFPR